MSENEEEDPGEGPKRLGTFGGVFTPSVLTILGIILFLRLGFVTGEAGLTRALIIIALANTISVLTSFSLAAIATNFEVKGGGDYFLISRTLGPQFGGAIGIVLFLAQSVSIAFYAIGFGEAVATMLGVAWLSPQVVAGVAVALLFVLAWLGADWATRLQYVIMTFLFAGIAAFVVGALRGWDPVTLEGNWKPGGELPFWAIFALFFPAVTGFTQGVSMSGELKDPAKSLPLGTFLAVGVSIVVYIGLAILFAGAVRSDELVSDFGAMRRISFMPWLVDAGVIGATLSSALASFLGAPRILQSLASDRVVRVLSFFAKGSGEANNPRRAVVFAGLIAVATIAVGDLNVIAPVVSMFFLISYGLLNYATFFEAQGKSPSFRPSFRLYHQRLSLLGCIACVGAIVAIHPTAGAISFALLMGIHQFLGRAAGPKRWADSSRSNAFQRIRQHLLSMTGSGEHPRDWRPVILAFSDNPVRRERLLRFASWIEGGSGLTTVALILVGEGARVRREREKAEAELAQEIREQERDAFARVIVTGDVRTGFPVLLQSSGMGPIRANTVLLSWYDQERFAEDAPGMPSFGSYLRSALRQNCNVIVFAATMAELRDLESTKVKKRRIDVWWRGDASSRLALLLAYLMTRSEEWDDSTVRVLSPVDADADAEDERAALRQMLEEVRIDAQPVVLPGGDMDALVAESAQASIVQMPFRLKDEEVLGFFGEALGSALEELPVVALVLAAQDIDLDAQPDEGPQAELAAALEQAESAEERARTIDKELEAATRTLEKHTAQLEKMRSRETPREELEELELQVQKAEDQVEQTRRRVAKAQAKAQHAREEVEARTGNGNGNGNGT